MAQWKDQGAESPQLTECHCLAKLSPNLFQFECTVDDTEHYSRAHSNGRASELILHLEGLIEHLKDGTKIGNGRDIATLYS